MPVLRRQGRARRKRPEVSALRHVALRAAKAVKRRGGRNGVSTRVARQMATRLNQVRALWLAVQNDPKQSIEDVAAEFYFAVGEMLEGHTVRSVTLRKIDRERAIAHAED